MQSLSNLYHNLLIGREKESLRASTLALTLIGCTADLGGSPWNHQAEKKN